MLHVITILALSLESSQYMEYIHNYIMSMCSQLNIDKLEKKQSAVKTHINIAVTKCHKTDGQPFNSFFPRTTRVNRHQKG